MTDTALHHAFLVQAHWCERLGSPFTAVLMRALARVVDRTTETGRTALEWPGRVDAKGDSLPLRIAGGLHALVRAGVVPALALLYPPHPLPEPSVLEAALAEVIAEADAALRPWLDQAPQTNEVGRAGVFMAGLTAIAALTSLPLKIFEVGASAGLNLRPDRYAIQLGGRTLGDPTSPVHLVPEWHGPALSGPEPAIASARGCDISPIDPSDPDAVAQLTAYIWADQTARLERLSAALALAAARSERVERGDACAWIAAILSEPSPAGITRVVMHSITAQYWPEATRTAFTATLAAAGTRVDPTGPLAWLAFEQVQDVPTLTLTLWPSGETRTLATGDAHGRLIRWF